MRRALAIALVLAPILAAGCGYRPVWGGGLGSPPAPVDRIDAVVAEAVPFAIKGSESSAPEGIRVRVMLFRSDQPQPVVGEGGLDFLLYLGKSGEVDPAKTPPFHLWSYTSPELEPFLSRNIVGWGYSMTLGWGAHVPTSPTVTVIVRYRPFIGDPIYAKPVTIVVSER
jgi:hypothetical protein